MLKLKLERPLAVMDIEATGATPRADRIVEIAIVRVLPGGARDIHTFRVNPQRPIPPAATKIHGISDADVANCPVFAAIAGDLLKLLEGCDLCGYNIIRYDLPMLAEEFVRAGLKFDSEGRRVIDAQRIFHKHEPRDLTAALAFYCNEMHFNAHGAESDALATVRVLEGQFKRYADLPGDMDKLDEYCNPREPDWVDRTGKLRWLGGEIVLNFGRKKDTPLRNLVQNDPAFVKWILKSDFPRDMLEIVENAAQGKWPQPPPA